MNKRNIIASSTFAAAGLVAGCLLSVNGVANAASTATTPSSATASSNSITPPTFGGSNEADATSRPDFDGKGGPQAGTAVTGDLKATLSDLATAKVAGATVDDVIKHADGTYDVHMTKADGTTHVSVEFDAKSVITDVHEMTGPAGGHGGFGPGDGDGDGPGNGLGDGDGPGNGLGDGDGGFTAPGSSSTSTPAPSATPGSN